MFYLLICVVPKEPRKETELLELELKVVVGHWSGGEGLLGNKLRSLGGSLSVGNYWTTSLVQSVLNITTPKFSSFPNICVLTQQSDLSLF